jgi:uncharacterized protein YbjT (DUF2867 family)
MTDILVIGAHGRSGSAITRELVRAGHRTIGTVRRPAHLSDLRSAGAHGRVLDLVTATIDDFRQPMTGADAVVYAAGSAAGDDRETVSQVDGEAIIRAADAALLAGIDRFVLISAHRADEDFGGDHVVHLLRAKRSADAHVRATSLGWTIIRPDALTVAPPTGRVRLGATVPHGALPRADLAHLIRIALETPGAARRQFEVTAGPIPIATALKSIGAGER